MSRALSCVFPWTSGAQWVRGPEGDALKYGNAVHAFAERLGKGEPCDPLDLAKAFGLTQTDTSRLAIAATHVRAWLSDREPPKREFELPLAYHVASGVARRLESNGHRDYSQKKAGEMTGTIDLVEVSGPVVAVYDYKTGRSENVEPIASNKQMAVLALMASRFYKVSAVRVGLVYIEDGGVWEDETTLDAFDLDLVAHDVRAMMKRLDEPATPVPGAWCRWCPVVASCPATAQAMAPLAGGSPLSLTIRDANHAADTRVRLKMVRDACESIETSLKDWIRANGPIPAGEGRVYGVREQSRETVNLAAKGAYEVVARHLGERAEDAIELSTTKTKIHAAIVADARARGEAKQIEEALFGELRDIGAMSVSNFSKLEEYEPKKTA